LLWLRGMDTEPRLIHEKDFDKDITIL
jgi:hypothetical protein